MTGNPLVFAGRPPAPVAEGGRLARKDRCVAGLKAAGIHAEGAAANEDDKGCHALLADVVPALAGAETPAPTIRDGVVAMEWLETMRGASRSDTGPAEAGRRTRSAPG